MFEPAQPAPAGSAQARVWEVGALCHAIADALLARFDALAVRGEISGFARAASGHCYFSIKDAQGQLRCAMFRRAASLLDFAPADGELVELRARLGLYEARGELQLIVESMQRAGSGALFAQFLRLKARLAAEGLFDGARKRALPAHPRGIGLVTSLGAAALHDVVSVLRRRAPHIPVLLAAAQVQGPEAPQEIISALSKLYRCAQPAAAHEAASGGSAKPLIDVILLVRGGGSIEDLWAFNDEQLARTLVQSPVPLVCGVGHETDFSIADFCADLRAPTPTAAAELVARTRTDSLAALALLAARLADAAQRQLDARQQRLDHSAARLGRPSTLLAQQRLQLARLAQRMRHGALLKTQGLAQTRKALQARLPESCRQRLAQQELLLTHAAQRLQLLDPRRVLQRGYALLTDSGGLPVSSVQQTRRGAALHATLADGTLSASVTGLQPAREPLQAP